MMSENPWESLDDQSAFQSEHSAPESWPPPFEDSLNYEAPMSDDPFTLDLTESPSESQTVNEYLPTEQEPEDTEVSVGDSNKLADWYDEQADDHQSWADWHEKVAEWYAEQDSADGTAWHSQGKVEEQAEADKYHDWAEEASDTGGSEV
jgi:hypothetical protein